MPISDIQRSFRLFLGRNNPKKVVLKGIELSCKAAAQLNKCKKIFDDLTRLNSIIKETLSNSNPQIQTGTLLHGSTYSRELISNVFRDGIISGELLDPPKPEDGETHFHADFYRVPDHTDLRTYIQTYSKPIQTGRMKTGSIESKYLPRPSDQPREDPKIAFIVSPNRSLEALQKFDPYHCEDGLVTDLCKLPYKRGSSESLRLSAIPIGVPPVFITGIIIGNGLQAEELEWLRTNIPRDVAIFDTTGNKV